MVAPKRAFIAYVTMRGTEAREPLNARSCSALLSPNYWALQYQLEVVVNVKQTIQSAYGIRFSLTDGAIELGRAYLYVMRNDLHTAPFGLLEDVYVDESQRGGGFGTKLVQEVVAAAAEAGCYKLIATSRASRPKVHELYRRLGFEDHGIEFRKNLGGA